MRCPPAENPIAATGPGLGAVHGSHHAGHCAAVGRDVLGVGQVQPPAQVSAGAFARGHVGDVADGAPSDHQGRLEAAGVPPRCGPLVSGSRHERGLCIG